MRNLGGALGLAIINTVATIRTDVHALHLKEALTWANAATMKGVAAITHGMTAAKENAAPMAALRKLAQMVQREAATLAYNDVLLLIAILFFAALPFTLLLAKPKPLAPGSAH